MLKRAEDRLNQTYTAAVVSIPEGTMPAAVWAGAWSRATAERMGRMLLTSAQLGVLLLAMHAFQLEKASGILKLTPLIFGGFLVHAALPLAYRAPFFLVLSFAAFGVVLGVLQAILLIAIGLALIGVCHLPIALRWRILVLAAMGAGLIALRGAWLPWALPWGQGQWAGRVLPVLGSMFMFRLVIYLYDLRHEKGREKGRVSIWRRLSYFFLLPNVCFLLFPVIDYRTYQRTYYDGDPLEIYQQGVLRIFRGLTHILLYRVVYYYLVPAPWAVTDLGSVVLFVVSAWLLFLRVSGVFHLVVGVLGLFGFNLPKPQHLYFLASSPNDLWPRASLYWKDFMMKVFYYPTFKPLQRRWGLTRALVVATLVVFVATWLLHSYQWFWVLGAFPFGGTDAGFWTIFAALVLANSLWELKRGKRRSLTQRATWSASEALTHASKVLGMFLLISLMWSWWSTRDTGRWLSILAKGGDSAFGAYAMLGLGIAGILTAGVAIQYALTRGWRFGMVDDGPAGLGGSSYRRSATVTSLGGLLLLGASQPQVQQLAGGPAGGFVASLQSERLNQQDAERQLRGYYETLLETDVPTSALSAQAQPPAQTTPSTARSDRRPLAQTDAVRYTGDALLYELKPSYELMFKRRLLRTNEWGMRDKAYTLAKPPGTYRIALLGGSISMGMGLGGEETYESLVEERLNREHAGGPNAQYEILNFAVGGYGLVQHVLVAERKIFRFEPDVVLYAAHSGEYLRTLDVLGRVIQRGAELPPFLRDLVRRAGIEPGMASGEVRRRLGSDPFPREIGKWGYRQIVEASRRNGAIPAWVFVPQSHNGIQPPETIEYMSAMASEAGFVVLNLGDAFDGQSTEEISVARGDYHPNALGNRLLADRLYEELRAHDGVLKLGLTGTGNRR
ncbi:MAG: hypothetical protein H0T48_00715 [Gemmatimonadaceae bacterium]|nr:hypothetical protein [Gemmatimonadaceae bacterium]